VETVSCRRRPSRIFRRARQLRRLFLIVGADRRHWTRRARAQSRFSSTACAPFPLTKRRLLLVRARASTAATRSDVEVQEVPATARSPSEGLSILFRRVSHHLVAVFHFVPSRLPHLPPLLSRLPPGAGPARHHVPRRGRTGFPVSSGSRSPPGSSTLNITEGGSAFGLRGCTTARARRSHASPTILNSTSHQRRRT